MEVEMAARPGHGPALAHRLHPAPRLRHRGYARSGDRTHARPTQVDPLNSNAGRRFLDITRRNPLHRAFCTRAQSLRRAPIQRTDLARNRRRSLPPLCASTGHVHPRPTVGTPLPDSHATRDGEVRAHTKTL